MRAVRPRFSVESRRAVSEALAHVRPIAARYGVTVAQLVLAWTLAQPGVTHLLVGARTPQQAVENAAAADISLAPADVSEISQWLAGLGDQLGSASPPATRN
jgi:aryl-alcohol dehydrogenase-like predicted oxidoreductase